MARRDDIDQGLLFGDSPVERALARVPPVASPQRVAELAADLPRTLRLGTSSWAFPGWRGLVYAPMSRMDELARHGLAAYGQHPLFRTVGLDRAFYSLLSGADASSLADLVPQGFRFLVKCHQSITRPDTDLRGSTYGDTAKLRANGRRNDEFLDASLAAERVISPAVEGFRDRLGPILFQFPPLDLRPSGPLGGARSFLVRLGTFLSRLPPGPLYVVEVRNRELLEPGQVDAYADALREGKAAHGFAVHPTLPSIRRQSDLLERCGHPIASQPVCSVRWLLGHGLGYDDAKGRYEPFDRIVDPDPTSRSEIVSLVRSALDAGRLAWVIANNKAEGSAPLTLEQLARDLIGK